MRRHERKMKSKTWNLGSKGWCFLERATEATRMRRVMIVEPALQTLFVDLDPGPHRQLLSSLVHRRG